MRTLWCPVKMFNDEVMIVQRRSQPRMEWVACLRRGLCSMLMGVSMVASLLFGSGYRLLIVCSFLLGCGTMKLPQRYCRCSVGIFSHRRRPTPALRVKWRDILDAIYETSRFYLTIFKRTPLQQKKRHRSSSSVVGSFRPCILPTVLNIQPHHSNGIEAV